MQFVKLDCLGRGLEPSELEVVEVLGAAAGVPQETFDGAGVDVGDIERP